MLNTQEHIDLMDMFERETNLPYNVRNRNKPAREDKSLWPKGIFYQHGETNQAFLIYRMGYSFGKLIGREQEEARAA